MKKTYVLLVACTLGVAACGDSSPVLTAPEGARFDGGSTMGTGNKSDTTSVSVSSTETTDGTSTTTERGGFTIGGGN